VRATDAPTGMSVSRTGPDDGTAFQLGNYFSDLLKDLQRCKICLALVQANSPEDAYERASTALFHILGLVNLAADAGKIWRSSSRVRGKLPVSEVLIAPHVTTHFESGALTHPGFWSDNWNGGLSPKALNPDKRNVWEKRFLNLLRKTRKSYWKDDCRSATARYFKAFTNPNLEDSFLDGWRLFENISGSRYESIGNQILRASNIFESNVEYKIIGRHLALRRNLLAHGHAIRSDDYETLVFQMLQFVTPFLERYILNSYKFRSKKEFWEFLDLPAQKLEREKKHREHRRQLGLLKKAAKFRGEIES